MIHFIWVILTSESRVCFMQCPLGCYYLEHTIWSISCLRILIRFTTRDRGWCEKNIQNNFTPIAKFHSNAFGSRKNEKMKKWKSEVKKLIGLSGSHYGYVRMGMLFKYYFALKRWIQPASSISQHAQYQSSFYKRAKSEVMERISTANWWNSEKLSSSLSALHKNSSHHSSEGFFKE